MCMEQMRLNRSTRKTSRAAMGVAVGMSAWCLASTFAAAAVSWDGEGNSNWWFDPVNWSTPDNPEDPLTAPQLPPNNDAGERTDIQINDGTGAWDVTGEGVVFDPDNDPFYPSIDVVPNGLVDGADFLEIQRSTPAQIGLWQARFGSPGYGAEDLAYPANYGPQTMYRLYVGRNATAAQVNVLTIKSGDLTTDSLTIIGRSGSTETNQNLGTIVQTGGSFRLIGDNYLDFGAWESSGWGNGTYDYRGGNLEVGLEGQNRGIRMSVGNSGNAGGVSTFIMRNPTTGGHVRVWDFIFGNQGIAFDDPQADFRGVSVAEFHFENGGTRPIQVMRQLQINNGFHVSDDLFRSSRLVLELDEAPATDGSGVPQNLGLFDVGYMDQVMGAFIGGSGDLNDDFVFGEPGVDRVFSPADGGPPDYTEGATVSAIFGATQYNWTITYTGNITWSDGDNSVVDTITGPGTGIDVVLIGLSSQPAPANLASVPEPGTVALAAMGLLSIAAWRRRGR